MEHVLAVPEYGVLAETRFPNPKLLVCVTPHSMPLMRFASAPLVDAGSKTETERSERLKKEHAASTCMQVNFDHEAPAEPDSEESAAYTELVALTRRALTLVVPHTQASEVFLIRYLGSQCQYDRAPNSQTVYIVPSLRPLILTLEIHLGF